LAQKRVQTLHKTFSGDIVEYPNWHRSETFGFAAQTFVPDCEIWIYGELLDAVPSPDGTGQLGVLIEKTADAVIVNGRPYTSLKDPTETGFFKDEPPVKPANKPVMDFAADKFREEAVSHKDIPDAYVVGATAFLPKVRTAFRVEERDDTVMITVQPKYLGNVDHILVEHNGRKAGYSLYKGPTPTVAQLNEQLLDSIFRGLTDRCVPGHIVLAGFGYKYSCPSTQRADLVSALNQIPELAVPAIPDPVNGKMRYEPLNINGYVFYSPMISDFVNRDSR